MFTRKVAKKSPVASSIDAQSVETKTALQWADPMSFYALEPRVVFDGAAVAVAADAAKPADAAPAGPAAEHAPADAEAAAATAGHDQLIAALGAAAAVPANSAANEIAFIDGSVPDAGSLIAHVQPGTAVVMLDPGRDGLAQIAGYLAGRSGVSAIHIVSHGSEGELRLGNAAINGGNLGAHADELNVIRSALAAGGDILLYGCDVAKGPDGQAFVADLAARTGADIAASTDDTGAALRGGNWQLETSTGSIGARTIDAPDWDGLLAPLVISTTALPTTTGATGINGLTGIAEGGVGYAGLWLNAGTIGGRSIDLKATVMSLSASTVSFFTQGDDASIILNGGAVATIKWEIFASGTSQSVYAVGSPDFRISDIDGVGGVINTRETVRPQLQGLTGYTLDSPTNLVATVSASGVQVSGTQNQNGENTSLTGFTWQDVSSWSVEYTLNAASGFANAVFRHDGDGDFTFASAQSVSLLSLDLDANNSAATGTAYQSTYVENAAGIPIVDTDVVISQNTVLGTTLGKANVVLSNAKTGDALSVGTLPAGITATIDTSVSGSIAVTLSGNASVASYQSALAAVRFANSSDAPNTADRLISVSVTNTTFGTTSNAALSTIHVTAVNDAPVAAPDATSGTAHQPITAAVLGNDSDVDGTIVPSSVQITGTASAGASLTVAGEGIWSVNTSNGDITFTALATFDGAPTPITYTVADNSGARSNAATVSVMPLLNDPHLDLSGPSAKVGAITYPHNGGYGANPSWASAAGLDRFTTVGAEAGGPGLTLSNDGSSGHITGVGSTTLAESIAQGEYVTMSFTTKGTIPETWIQETALRIAGGQFKFAFAISTDGFQSATLLSKDNPANIYTGSVYDGNTSYSLAPATDYQLQPNTTYELRAYIYAMPGGAAATGTWDDLYVIYANDPTSYQTTFTENGTAVAIVAPAVEIEDTNNTNMASGTVTLTNKQASDQLLVSGIVVSNGSTGTVTGIGYSVVETAGTTRITLTGSASKAAYASALNAITFKNTSDNPVTVDRFVNVTINDGTHDSNLATSTIHVVPVNDAPTATNNTNSVIEDSPLTATGNVITDNNGAGVDSDVENAPLHVAQINGTIVSGATVIAGTYGTLTINPDGSYSYALDNASPTVQALNPSQALTENFSYTISEATAGTTNGSLEGTAGSVDRNSHNATLPPNWSLYQTPDVFNAATNFNGYVWAATPDGGDFLHATGLGGYQEGFQQTISGLTPGQQYTINFSQSLANNGYGPSGNGHWQVSFGAESQAASVMTTPVLGLAAGWQAQSLTFTASSASQSLLFFAVGDSGGNRVDLGIDGISIASTAGVPLTATANLTITITGTNDAPIATGETAITAEDTTLSVAASPTTGLLANDTDVDGGAISITQFTVAGVAGTFTPGTTAHIASVGDLKINANGSYTFTPAADFNGAVPVATYTISDGVGGTATAELALSVTPTADIVGDSVKAQQDSSLTFNPLTGTNGASADNFEGTPVVTAVSAPAHGSVSFAADGTMIYTPDTGYYGGDSFNYTVESPAGVIETATVTIAINAKPIVVAPLADVASDDGNTVNVPTSGAFADPDGVALTYTVASGLPAGLSIDPSTGVISGTLHADASINGPTSNGIYVMPVTATDPTGASVTTNITLKIGNPLPIAQNDAVITAENAPLSGSVFANNGDGPDTDGGNDSDTLLVGGVVTGSSAPVAGIGLATPVAGDHGGTFIVQSNGAFAFKPGTAFDDLAPGETRTTTVTYMIDDGNGGTAAAALTVTVTGTNDAPVVIDPATGLAAIDPATAAIIPGVAAQDGSPMTPLSVGGFFKDVDTSQGAPALSVDTQALPPGITFNPATRTFEGTPTQDASQGHTPTQPIGTYKVPVTATDPAGATVTTFVMFTISNPAPIAQNDAVTTAENTPLSGSVLADNGNGPDLGGPLGDTDAILVGGVITGTATPVAGAGLATPVAGDHGGTFVVQPNGVYAFNPGTAFEDLAPGEARTTTVTYMISDGNGGTAAAALTVTVTGTNDAPVVIDPATGLAAIDPTTGQPLDPATAAIIPGVSAQDGSPMTPLSVSGFFQDVDTSQGPPALSVDTQALPPGITFNPVTGTFEGTPTHDASQGSTPGRPSGTYKVPVTATDPTGASVTTFVTFTIGNPAPIARNDAVTTAENAPLSGNVFADNGNGPDLGGPLGDTDAILVGGVITGTATPVAGIGLATPVAGDHGGTFVVQPNGAYAFNPGTAFDDLAPGETRITTVTYMIDDGNGGTATAAFSVTVTGTNDAPVVIDPATGLPPVDPVSGLPLDPATAAIIPGVAAQDGSPITPVAVGGFFADADTSQGAPALTGDTSALPPGITFNAATGTFEGTPTSNASQGNTPGQSAGTYKVPVTATDPTGASVTTFVTFTIGNPAPIAYNDLATTAENAMLAGNVLADNGNGADTDGGRDGDTLLVGGVITGDTIPVMGVGLAMPVAGDHGGTFTVQPNGAYVFTPGTAFDDLAPGETRTTTVSYIIADGNGGSAVATLTVTVTGTNDAPVVIDPATGLPVVDPTTGSPLDPTTAAIIPGVAVKDSLPITPVVVAGFFADVDASQGAPTLTVDASALPSGITFDPPTGTFSGTPAHDASQGSSPGQPAGTYKVPVTATDPAGGSVTTYVTFTITNPPPVAVDDHAVVDEGRSVVIPAIGNDHDPDGDAIKVVKATSAEGDVVINPDGSLTFTPRPGFAGDATITYVIADSDGGTATAKVAVTVRAQFTPLPAVGIVTLPEISAVLPAQPLVSGAIADALNGGAESAVDGLRMAGMLGEHGMIGNAVNGAGGLGSLDGSSALAQSGGAILAETNRLGRLWQADDLLRQVGFSSFSVEKLGGASFRIDTETAAGGSFAKAGIMIDSVNRDGVLMIMLEQTSFGAREAGRVVDFRITQADGSPLPDWLERPSNDLVQGRRAANAEVVDLTVTAIFADGREITQNMRVQAVTGDIKPLPERRADLRPRLFAEQFDLSPMLTAQEGRLLADALTP